MNDNKMMDETKKSASKEGYSMQYETIETGYFPFSSTSEWRIIKNKGGNKNERV
ncbi:MAG: hypothetical protein ISS95_00665 [Candidatus Aenigmarchaeota archaeon]|nr:hypothetical protein [Candidatus Aenigmarchaeota archaeon]